MQRKIRLEHRLDTELKLPLPLETVFAFFARATNLERITPPHLRFRILTPEPVEMRVGTLIRYRLQLFRVPFDWTTLISTWNPPHSFRDEQIQGPYALWEHTHTFEACGSGTRIRDSVRYRLPLWPIGEAAYPFVRAQLRHIFAYRQEAVRRSLNVSGMTRVES
jgi:ligand-binding SRPBCC domain-containing protein